MEKQVSHKTIELQNEIEKLKEENNKRIGQINGENVALKGKNAKLEEENSKLTEEIHELKEKMSKIEAYMKKKKIAFPCRILPAELFSELFGSLPFENAFGLLTKMPNGLLARNVQKMINSIKEAMKKNKLNSADCGPKLAISEDGLDAKHSGTEDGWNCGRVLLPIPLLNLKEIIKPKIVFYFEVQILNNKLRNYGDIVIGFCTKQFSLEGKLLGCEANSIGFWRKDRIMINGSWTNFENVFEYFKKRDIIGIGIIHHPNSTMKCFATYNGKLLGKAALPSKFVNVTLFPVIELADAGDSIDMNFGKEKFQFEEFGRVLE